MKKLEEWMHVDRPVKHNGEWVVRVRNARSPYAPTVEIIPCGTQREAAWQSYLKIKLEVKAMPKTYIDIIATKKNSTLKAVLLVANGVEAWFPNYAAKPNGDGTWTVDEEMAHEKGIV